MQGSRLYPVYAADCLTEKRSRITAEQLTEQWRKKYGSEEIVLVEAIRFANRLQKVKKHPEFYAMKDTWIRQNQHQLVDGRVARVQNKMCWDCNGNGNVCGDTCGHCRGTGIYSSRTLYEHNFEIGGRKYCFHSYVRPEHLSEEPGADLLHYGHPFTPGELPMPPQSVLVSFIKMLLEHHEKAR